MLTNFDSINSDELRKIFTKSKSKSFILSCYNILSENLINTQMIDENPCVFSCQVELIDLIINKSIIKLECNVVTLFEGFYGCKELIEDNKINLIVNKENIYKKEIYVLDKLILDRIFSFYTINIPNINGKIQRTWIEVTKSNENTISNENSNYYIKLYCVNADEENDLTDLVLF